MARELSRYVDSQEHPRLRQRWQGVRAQGYMDPSYSTAYFLLEAPDLDAAHAHLATYPQVQSGQSTYDVVQLIGLPAIEQSERAAGRDLPGWWPPSA